jgi:hypothetical protein
MQRGTVEALVEAAAKAPPEISDELRSRAALKSVGENNADRARQIAAGIANPVQRETKMREIEQEAFSRNAQRAKLEDAAQHIPGNASVEERVAALIYLAHTAAQRSQKAIARRFLDDALGFAAAPAENQFQFSTQLQVAHAYASVDLDRSFSIIESVIDRLNELLDAAAMLDGFGGDSFKEGELKAYNGGMWEELLRLCCEELASLAVEDADRALAAAGRLRRPEAQTLAIIRIGQRVLPEPAVVNPNHARK